jgi:hypothetical protein
VSATEPVVAPRGGRVRALPAGFAFGVGHLLALIGAVAVIVSIFLKWEDLSSAGRLQTARAKDVPVQFLFDYTTGAKDPSLVLILAASAAMILVGVLLATQLPGGRVLAWFGAALAIAIAAMYGFQVHQALRALHLGKQIGVTDFIGIGPYVTFGGGILALVGVMLPAPRVTAV